MPTVGLDGSMQPLAPIFVVEVFPEVRQRLVALLTSLSDAQWGSPTVRAEWSVKGVTLPLLGVNVANLSRRRDGFDGGFDAFVPPGTDLADHPTMVTGLAERNEAWVVATRRLSLRQPCQLLTATGGTLDAHSRGLDLLTRGNPVRWAGPEQAPVWLDVAREYTEQWTHQVQIPDALGLPVLDEPRLFAPVLDAFIRALPHTLRGTAAPTDTCLRVTITGEASGEWLAVRQVGHWALGRDSTRSADASVTLDQFTAWRPVTKGLCPAGARRVARVEGDSRLAHSVLEMVAIIA